MHSLQRSQRSLCQLEKLERCRSQICPAASEVAASHSWSRCRRRLPSPRRG